MTPPARQFLKNSLISTKLVEHTSESVLPFVRHQVMEGP